MSLWDAAALGTINLNDESTITFKFGPEKCPLPRIGSKEWGWHPSCYAVVSTRNNYHLVYDENNQMWLIYDVDGVLVATSRNQPEAQNIAELLTRRDWRRENRGKK